LPPQSGVAVPAQSCLRPFVNFFSRPALEIHPFIAFHECLDLLQTLVFAVVHADDQSPASVFLSFRLIWRWKRLAPSGSSGIGKDSGRTPPRISGTIEGLLREPLTLVVAFAGPFIV